MANVGVAGGAFGIITAFCAWYVALAGLLTPDTSFFMIPIGPLGMLLKALHLRIALTYLTVQAPSKWSGSVAELRETPILVNSACLLQSVSKQLSTYFTFLPIRVTARP